MNDLARLRWQCRRGVKELDVLLERYLETGYLLAGDEEKDLFVALLKLEDDALMGVFLGDSAEGEMMLELVERIRAFAGLGD